MMEERYHATTQNRFYLDMSNVNKNITIEAKLINPHTHIIAQSNLLIYLFTYLLTYLLTHSMEQSPS